MISVFTITYNEEVILPHFIQHYRSRFPGCKIHIRDNESTDNTVTIAKAYGCEVQSYYTDDTIDDSMYLSLKNGIWKHADTDWVVVVDCDEFLDITPAKMENAPFNIIKATGYDMCGTDGNINNIFEGIKSDGYSKICCFRRDQIKEINYEPGCHNANPVPVDGFEVKFNAEPISLFHFKWISWEYGIARMLMFGKRLSETNKKFGWGIHYSFPEATHRKYYDDMMRDKIKIRQTRI